MIWTLEEIKARHKATGGHWFDPGALRFFSSRLSSKVFPVDGGALFITSEQFQGMYLAGGRYVKSEPRRYSIRFCSDGGEIETVGTFQEYRSLTAARHAAKRIQEQRNAID